MRPLPHQPAKPVDLDAIAKQMTERAVETYSEHAEKAALRCALGDAAHFCDAVERFVKQQHTKRGRLTKHGAELSAIAKLCGDEIWKMRGLIDMTQPAKPKRRRAAA